MRSEVNSSSGIIASRAVFLVEKRMRKGVPPARERYNREGEADEFHATKHAW